MSDISKKQNGANKFANLLITSKLILKSSFLSILFILLFLASCQQKSSEKSMLYTSGGKTSEVLVVISKNYWTGQIGDSVKSVLQDVKPWFAQEEPTHDIMQIEQGAFMDVYQKFRNVLIIKINSDVEQNQIKAHNNVYAQPQTIIEIKCKTQKDFLTLFGQNSQKIMDLFHANELSRIQNAYSGLKIDSLSKKLIKKFGFQLVIPKGFYVAVDKPDFIWLRKMVPDIEEGIMIYSTPYFSTLDFSQDSIIARRNYFTKRYIPGPIDSSFMKVSSVFPAYYEITDFKDNYSVLLRSWWDVEKYAMGGPFLNYTFVDTAVNQIISIDGFIKAPRKNKRDLLLHVESIIHSYQKE